MSDTKAMSTRAWIHRLVDVIEDEGDMEMVKWLLQPYAARSLNKKYREEHSHEEDQGHDPA